MSSSDRHIITCYFLGSVPEFYKEIQIEVKDYDRSQLRSTIKEQLLSIYPGIEQIELFLTGRIYKILFTTNDKEVKDTDKICISNTDFQLPSEHIKNLSEIYIQITNIYGEENFTSIQKVKCNFTTPEGKPSFVNMLLPNVPLPLNIFKEALKNYAQFYGNIIFNDRDPDSVDEDVLKKSSIKFVDSSVSVIEARIKNLQIGKPNNETKNFNLFIGNNLLFSISFEIDKSSSEQNFSHLIKINDAIKDRIHIYKSGGKLNLIGIPIDSSANNYFQQQILSNRSSYANVLCLIGPSGCGKTSTLFEIARNNHLVYIEINALLR